MKKIECYIRPERLEKVKKALFALGVKGMSITDAKGHGHQGGIKLTGRAGDYVVEWIDKLKLELVVSETMPLEKIMDIIVENAATGKPGDGKIFVLPVEEAIRIRTRETGEGIL